MQRPPEVHLALDVGYAALAHPDTSGDARRPPECEVTELQDRQRVDLADLAALGIDENDLAADGFLRPVPHAIGALRLLIDGARDILSRGHRAARFPRPIVGLPHDVRDAADLDREPLPVAGEACALLEHAGRSAASRGFSECVR